MPIFFWFLSICLAVACYVSSEYLIDQHSQRVDAAVTISAKGLANVIDERIVQHRLMTQSMEMHHRERILALVKGGAGANEFLAIEAHLKTLLLDARQFAVLDQYGKVVIGSSGAELGGTSQNFIKAVFHNTSDSYQLVAYRHVDGQLRYDLVVPIGLPNVQGGLFISFSFERYKQLIGDFNTQDFEFILLDGSSNSDVIASSAAVGSSLYGDSLNPSFIKDALVHAPIQGAQWVLLGVPADGLFDSYKKKIYITALVVFLSIFVLLLIIQFYLKNLESVRTHLAESSVQDALFNTGPTVLFQKQADSNMAVQYVSPNVCTLLGCKTDELLREKSFTDLIWPEDVATVRMAIMKALSLREVEVALEFRLQHQKEHVFCWVYELTRILYDDHGQPVVLQSYITSIHAQKMAEQQANKLIENAPNAIAITDRYGVIFRVNNVFEKLFEYDRSELMGHSIELCVNEEANEELEAFKQQLVTTSGEDFIGLGLDSPVLGMTKTAEELSLEVSLSLVETLEGVQLVHMVRDISVQISAQKQMQVAKESAEELAKARSRFVATMSHEIRTPLNGILGMSNLLQATALNQQQSSYLQAIEYSGQSLLTIINSILDFAKLDEGAVALESHPMYLVNIVNHAIDMLQTQAKSGEVAVYFENRMPSDDCFIGDEVRIQQVLLNLIDNAIKFSPGGRVDISLIETVCADHFSRFSNILIKVKDTGIGIHSDNLDKLFDSFTQADESTTRKYGGTGLGLAISKQLVDLMGGSIEVTSEEGQGSIFWLRFSLEKPSPPSQSAKLISTNRINDTHSVVDSIVTKSFPSSVSAPLMPSVTRDGSQSLQNKTVLLIEDEEVNQRVVAAFLQRLGARVDIAGNGMEGLSFWRTHQQIYDLIIMDCQMPVMDGYEATKMIRKEEGLSQSGRSIPIVALTANAMSEDKERCLSVGMSDYITKPIDLDRFNYTMAKWANYKQDEG
ncbi:MAG: two-component system, sensor histidine kinase [Thiomicrorhabdus sp.]|nr:MAG: two-component system, sensor histidine kinase [Thiomicrorhabdus sp.]